MKLIIGLGNPGKKYEKNWHNLGFAAVGIFRQSQDFPEFRKSLKFKGEVSKKALDGETIILLRPLTFMNRSGLSAKAVSTYFKIDRRDIIIIHDDLDLPLGKLRLAGNSSAGGHNGVKSIIEELGGREFSRIKIGIKTERLKKINPADYVLTGPADTVEEKIIKSALEQAAAAIEEILKSGPARAMNKYN